MISGVIGVIALTIVSYVIIALIRAIHFHVKHRNYNPDANTSVKSENQVGKLTIEELSKCNGMDPYRPLLVAIRGKIFNVSRGVEFYGPGKAYGVYAGKEISRALGKMSLDEADCNGELGDLTEKQMTVLAQWEEKFTKKYPVVGEIVPSMVLSLDELKEYDGTDASKPMLLSIRGVIFDVSSGKAFYGPDGSYPFAGRECARAFAKYSLELEDCVSDVSNCSVAEMDALRSWEAQFQSKYPVVGRVAVDSSLSVQ